ncbi:P-loop NTPase fold protein [Actinomadura sp. 1N219]|uniref:P-loop NTPase fold protein n=1 Tax=Actinomadura sp. 1N219 TaxID=3375152 RepID=UPI0037B16DEA
MAEFNFPEFLESTVERLLRTDPELRYGRDFEADIIATVRAREREIKDPVAAELEKLRWSQVLRATPVIPYLTAATVAVGALVASIVFYKSIRSWGVLAIFFSTTTTIVCCAQILNSFVAAQKVARQRVKRAALPQLQSVIREVINEQERSDRRWSSRLETDIAPALVELDGLDTVSSRSYRRIYSFITDHASSAVGVAGPRGSGKSTLMWQLMADDKLGARIHGLPIGDESYRTVRVSAPVYYSPAEFTRIIHSELAHSGLKPAARDPRRLRIGEPIQGRLERIGRRVGYAVLLIVAMLIWYWERDSRSLSDTPNKFGFGWLGFLALVFLVLVAGWGLSSIWRLFVGRVRLGRPNTLAGLCKREVELLKWSTTVESTASAALRLGRSGAEGVEKLTRNEREVTHAESVQALRQFIDQFVHLSGMSVVICVDELDKMPDPDKAVEAINGIKDLFHIPGAHFLLSVSTDALHSFAARGVPVRDVFDSSFDTIVRISPLNFDESQKLLSRRATRFSAVFALFCHAWSGGLARDVIRTARSCVEHAKEGERSVSVLSDKVLRLDVSEVVRAAVEKLREEADDSAERVLEEVLTLQDLLESDPGMFYEIAETAVGQGMDALPDEF